MITITHFAVEGLEGSCLSDNPHPCFSFSVSSDEENVFIKSFALTMNGWTCSKGEQTGISYEGRPLEANHSYEATLEVSDERGEKASASLAYQTGKMGESWHGEWISDPLYHFKDKKISPRPMVFKKTFSSNKKIVSAMLYATALGIYQLELNGAKLGDRFFAPGYTTYKANLQYQAYDVTQLLKKDNTLYATVAGGWAVGSFVYTRTNRHDGDRQAFRMELRLLYEDGSIAYLGSDSSFLVSEDGPFRMADFYDGETYDARIDLEKVSFHPAAKESLRIHPELRADYSNPVKINRVLLPKKSWVKDGLTYYDFGQNFAGLVRLSLFGKTGEKIVIRHAEVLNEDGSLAIQLLRSAQATLTYYPVDGEQTYTPSFTYMGFRYVSLEGISPEQVKVEGLVLSSDLAEVGSFECSDPRLNRLNENVLWSSRSNFMDIPTDCPQRDERMGWTGDISFFAPTACLDFSMDRFLRKWLKDLQAEQLKTGGLPNTIPEQGFTFPVTMPHMAVDFWGDACLEVPYALYRSYGDKAILASMYENMRRYVKACQFWAGIWGIGEYRYLWHTPSMLHFGDWVAPDEPSMAGWQKRSVYTATASLAHTSSLLSEIAIILGKREDASYFAKLSKKVSHAYRRFFCKEPGLLKKEFQTAYVLPLYFGIFEGEEKKKAASALARLVEKGDYKIGTGFPGTPYVLFALADNGYADVAYKMLLNEKCPSWLYAVKLGATTIWEKFDGLDERGYPMPSKDGTDNMISFNHYASGSVVRFLYERVVGLTPLKPGYQEFQVKPLLGGELSYARFGTRTPYGEIKAGWEKKGQLFTLEVSVPVGTRCHLVLPSGKKEEFTSGVHRVEEELSQ
jgi:alpha-L-rhamnosidase